MKKIIITAISAIAVIASVIGCQIYDSQTNKVLASWMDKDGSDVQKLEELAADFNQACSKLKSTPTDMASYNKIVDTFLGFDKFYAAALTAVNGYLVDDMSNDIANKLADVSADAVGQGKTQAEVAEIVAQKETELKLQYALSNREMLHDKEKCIAKYKEIYMTKDRVINELIPEGVNSSGKKVNYGTLYWQAVKIKANSGEESATWSINVLYEDAYKLRWDYNSKK